MNETTAIQYNNWKQKEGPNSITSCDAYCRKLLFCETSTTGYDEYQTCIGRTWIDVFGNPLMAIFIFMDYPWYEMIDEKKFKQ
jgi:hypothetical protein